MPRYSLCTKWVVCFVLCLTFTLQASAQQPAPLPQLQLLEGHTAPVYAVATSPDGTTLLSASLDGTIRAWDRATNQPIRVLGKHLPGVLSLAASPTGLHFAAGGLDKQVRIYDLPSNYPRAIVPNMPNTGGRIDVLADGSAALTSDISRTVRLWSLANNQPIRDFAGSTNDVTSVLVVAAYEQPPAPPAETPTAEGDGAKEKPEEEKPVELPPPVLKPKFALAAAKDGTVRVWDINSAQQVALINTAPQNSLAASRAGDLLVGAGEDGLLRNFRWPLSPPVSLPGLGGDQTTSVAISADGKLLVAGSLDSKVNIYKAEDGTALHALAGQTGKTTSVAINGDSSLVAGGSDLGTIKFWSVEDAADRLSLAGHVGAVNRLAYPKEGTQIASAGVDGTVRIWNPPTASHAVPGHAAALTVVAATADGETALSAGADKQVRLWKVASGEELRAIKDLPQPVASATFSKDGKLLALGDAAGTISLQSTADGADQGSLLAHAGAVTGVAISPDAKRLVSSGADGLVKLWSLPLQAPQTVTEGEQPITGVAISTDAKFLITGSADGKLQMLDGASGEPLKKLPGEAGAITNLTLSADNATLAVANSAGGVQLWNTAEGTLLGGVNGHTGAVLGVALHPKEPLLATAGEDFTVRVWQKPVAPKPVMKSEKPVNTLALSADGALGVIGSADGKTTLIKMADGKPAAKIEDVEVGIVSAEFKKDGTSLATGDEAGNIRLYSPADGASQGAIAGHEGPVTAMAFNPNPAQPLLASSGADGTVKLWQLPFTPGSALPVSKAEVTAAAVSADGVLTVVASADQSVRVFDSNGTQSALIEKLPAVASSVAITGDGKQMLLGLANGQVQVHNTANGALVAHVAGQPAGLTALAVSGKAPQFATAGQDGSVRVWQMPSEVLPLGNHTGAITAIRVSPNGQLVATAAADKSVRVWKLADGAEMWTLGHAAPVTALAWKADSSQLATGDGKSIRLWNIADGSQVATFDEHAAEVTGLAFSADGASLISASKDKQVKVWKLAPATDEEKVPVTIEGAKSAITALAAVGPTVVTGEQEGTVRTWNLAEAKPGLEIKHGEPVTVLAVSADQKLIAAGGKSKTVKLYSVADGKAGPELAGLAGAVTDVAISGDNLRVAATSAEGDIRVWGVTGELLDMLVTGDAKATALAFAPDNKSLLVGAADNKVRNLAPSLIKEIKASEKSITSLDYTPDGSAVLTGGQDKTVKLWTLADGKAVREFPDNAAAITAVEISLDGTKVFAAAGDKTVRCWNLADAKLISTLTHPSVVKTLSASADNLKLATGAEDGQVRVWNLALGRLLQRFAAHSQAISALAFYPDNKTILSGGLDQAVIKSTVAATVMLAAHEGGAFGVSFTADGSQLLSGGADNLVKQFDLAGMAVRQFAGAEGAIRSLALRPDGAQLAAGSDDKHVHFWTVANGAVERKVATPAAVGKVAYNADGTRVAATGADKHLRIVQSADGRLLEDQTLAAAATAAAFLPDGKSILLGNAEGNASIYEMSLVRLFAGHTAPVENVAFVPNGTFLVSGGTDKSLILWNQADGATVRAMAHPDAITGLAVSPDGTFAWTTCVDKSLRQWNVTNGQALWALATDQPLRSLTVNAEGTRGAISADDKSIRVIDLASQKELQRFLGHEAVANRLALAGDNRTLVSAGSDKTARKWNIAAERVIVADVGKVNALALLPDGSQIVSAGDDHLTKLWDLEGKLVRQLGGNPTAVRSIAVRPDGMQIALGGDPASAQVNVYLFNVADGAHQLTIATPAGIHSLAYSPDGKLAVSEADNHVRLYETTTGKLLQDFTFPAAPGSVTFANDQTLITGAADNNAYVFTYSLSRWIAAHEGSVTGLAYLPDGKHVVSAGADKTVKLWNLAEGTMLASFVTADQPVNDLAISGDGQVLAAVCADNNARVWNLPKVDELKAGLVVQPAHTFVHPAAIASVGLNGDGNRLVVGCNDGQAYVWDVALEKQLERLQGNTSVINSVKISSDGSLVLSGGLDKTAWRWMTGVKSAAVVSAMPLSSVACAPDGSQAFTAGTDGVVKGWNSADLTPAGEFKGQPAGATFVATGPDGKYLSAAGSDGTLQLWEIEGAKPVASLKTPTPAVGLELGAAAQKLVVAGNDNVARCYELAEQEEKPALQLIQQALGATLPITGIALAEDDHTLVAVSDDRNIRRYHMASGAPVKEFTAHEKAVYGLAYNAAGTQLATAGGDHTVGVWDLVEDKLITRCEGHQGQVQSVSFHPAGNHVASAALDGTVRVWSLTANLPGERPDLPKRKAKEDSLAPRPATQPLRPRESGLIAERFATNNLTGEAEIDVDKQIDFDWEDKQPEPFSIRWRGFITAPATGEVTFTAEADDGLRLYVGGKAIIDGTAANGPREGKLMMTAEESLPVQVEFYQTAEKALIRLYWSWEGQEKQLIPAEAWEHQPVYVGDQVAEYTEGVSGGLMAMRYAGDGSSLVAAGTGKKWYLWTTADGKLAREGIGHNETIYSLSINPAGNRLATLDYSGQLFIWDFTNANPLFHQQLPTWAGHSVCYLPDGTEVIAGTQSPKVMKVVIPPPAR